MADNKKGSDTEFDDETFDTEFSDIDFEDGTLEDDGEFAELSDEDVEDFENDEWQDEESGNKKGKDKSLYTGDEKRGLSFNAMVMIGAVVLGGGVLAFNIMNESSKAKAGEKTMFQSIMGMAGVMDGILQGEDEYKPTQEDIIAQEQQSQTEGFLNNPDVIQPPQPAPIAPSEEAPLTPMPDQIAGETPRGPDEPLPPEQTGAAPVPGDPAAPPAAPTDLAAADANGQMPPADGAASDGAAPDSEAPAPGSAEDLLKKAMADRQQKSDAAGNADTGAPAVTNMSATEETPADEPALPSPNSTTAPAMPETATVPAGAPVAGENVAALEAKIDTLTRRLEQIESDLGSVKSEKSANYEEIEQTVASLRQDVSALKDRPSAGTSSRRDEAIEEKQATTSVDSDEPQPAPKPKKRIRKAAAKQPAATPSSSNTSGRWELRAAQPGRAWVSKPGQRDMQTVEVGQNLSGIGQVTAISYQNGRWTVYGSQGQIQQ